MLEMVVEGQEVVKVHSHLHADSSDMCQLYQQGEKGTAEVIQEGWLAY